MIIMDSVVRNEDNKYGLRRSKNPGLILDTGKRYCDIVSIPKSEYSEETVGAAIDYLASVNRDVISEEFSDGKVAFEATPPDESQSGPRPNPHGYVRLWYFPEGVPENYFNVEAGFVDACGDDSQYPPYHEGYRVRQYSDMVNEMATMELVDEDPLDEDDE